jgi:hypothetical protein
MSPGDDIAREAEENRPDGRRPPLAPRLRGLHAICVQAASYLTKAPSSSTLVADTGDNLGRETRLATRTSRPLPLGARLLPPFGQVALELGDGDQPRA